MTQLTRFLSASLLPLALAACSAAPTEDAVDTAQAPGVDVAPDLTTDDFKLPRPDLTGLVKPAENLGAYHGGCSAAEGARAPHCVSAIARYCQARGFGGGISQEVSATEVVVACFHKPSTEVIRVPIKPGFLEMVDSVYKGCLRGASQSLPCLSMAYGECVAKGHSGGVVQEVGKTYMDIACVDGSAPRPAFQFTLEAQHPGCRGTNDLDNGDCMAAAHRQCVREGYRAGVVQGLGHDGIVKLLCADAAIFTVPYR